MVGNDGFDEKFDEFYDRNVRYFSLTRNPATSPRNGCFIRNYFIKRCESKFIFQKDPETVVKPMSGKEYDWIEAYANCKIKGLVKPKFTLDLGDSNARAATAMDVKNHYRFHWGALFYTKMLQYMQGYDQDYHKYGYEDTDLYQRILYSDYTIGVDEDLIAIHQWHPVDPEVYYDVAEMQKVFNKKRPLDFIRNDNIMEWGEG